MRVALLGDTHGNEAWLTVAIELVAQAGLDTIIQVGDLGIWPGPHAARMWDRIDHWLDLHGQTMLVVPGNHEDYDQIDQLKPHADGWLPFRERILLAPRGHRSELGGRTICWLGGAASPDRGWRRHRQSGTGQRTWWPQEAITPDDVERTIAGGHAEIMITHDAPHGVPTIEARIAGPTGFRPEDLEYASDVRQRLTQAVHGVRPKLLVHGHFHFAVDEIVQFDEFSTHIFGLGADGDAASLGVLDLDTLEASFLGPPTRTS